VRKGGGSGRNWERKKNGDTPRLKLHEVPDWGEKNDHNSHGMKTEKKAKKKTDSCHDDMGGKSPFE